MHYAFHSTPTYTFKSRTQGITQSNQLASLPSPNHYSPQKSLQKPPTIANSKSKRDLYKRFEDNPGPGAYETKQYITDGAKKTMSSKYPQFIKQSPGPHSYMSKPQTILSHAPQFSMGNRSKSLKQIDFDHNNYKPGPTNYEIKGTLNRKNGVVIGSSHRQDLTETQKTPAPNRYQITLAYKFSSQKLPQYKLGTQFRKTTSFMKAQATPGPAFYPKGSQFEQNKNKNKGFSCRSKVQNLIAKETSKMPAPGQYQSHLKHKNKAPGYSTGYTARSCFIDDVQKFKKSYPGPQIHNPHMFGTKYGRNTLGFFAHSARKPLDENQKTPGPAVYTNQTLKTRDSAPKFSTGKTIPKNQFLGVNPQNPGPGQYEPKMTLVKSHSSIFEVPKEKRPNFEKHRKTPGPGFYNLRGKEGGPQWRFSQAKRMAFTDSKNQAKDGSHYNITAKVVDPPNYMNVNSKINFTSRSSSLKAIK